MADPSSYESSTDNCCFESIYGALRAQARQYLRREYNAHSMSPTILVHEAWVSLAASSSLQVKGRSHYVRLFSRVMRNLLIDHARRKKAAINGGALRRVECSGTILAREEDADKILAVAAALDRLAQQSPHLATLVELRYFAGFNECEIAQIMGISSRSVRRQWNVARLRLIESLQYGRKPGVCADA
jgi:RNA polymerase sigma factor (TIGR02999 family)